MNQSSFIEAPSKEPDVDDVPVHEYIRITCCNCGYTVDVPVYCGNRFCQVCSSPRKKRVRSRISWLIRNRPKVKGTMIKHLTLTIKNDTDLNRMVKNLIASFRRMRNRKAFKAKIVGGAFVIELTKTGDTWHAHIHAIIQSHKVEWKMLRDMWLKCSKGSRGVWIDNIPPDQAVWYLTKYITKSDLSIDNQLVATELLKNYRLFNPFGSWYAVNLEYVPEPHPCPTCKCEGMMMPYDIIIGNWEGRFG